MNQRKNESVSELSESLAKVVSDIATKSVPDTAVEQLIASASRTPLMANDKTNHVSIKPRSRTLPSTFSRVMRIAIASALVASVLVIISLFPSGESRLFASMQDAMAKIKSMQLTTKVVNADDEILETIKSSLMMPRKIRQEFSDGSIVIANITDRKAIWITPKGETAQTYQLNGPDASIDFFDRMMDVITGADTSKATKMGEQKIGEVATVEYKVVVNSMHARIFIDEENSLPVKVIMPIGDNGVRVEATQFKFNTGLDTALFALKAPEGYEVKEIELNENRKELTNRPSTDDSDLTLTRSTLGQVRLGMTTAEVTEILGKPEVLGHPYNAKKDTTNETIDVLNYFSRGIQVVVKSDKGATLISCSDASDRFSVQRFTGQYDGGIRIGDSLATVVDSLGKPDSKKQDAESKSSTLIYGSESDDSVTAFSFVDSKLVRMTSRCKTKE